MNPVASEINDILESNPVAEEIDAIIHSREEGKIVNNPVAFEIERIIEDCDYNPIADEINDILEHEGVSIKDGAPGRGSGRYPLGSGKNPYQHQDDFLGRVQNLRAKGYSWVEVAEEMHVLGKTGKPSSTNMITQYQVALHDKQLRQTMEWQRLRDEGKTYEEIAQLTGAAGESTVREALKHPERLEKAKLARKTADYLKAMVAEDPKSVIDVGENANTILNISPQKLNEALYLLEQEGYNVYTFQGSQVTNKKTKTTMKVLADPEFAYKDLYIDSETGIKRPPNLRVIDDSTRNVLKDAGETLMPAFVFPESFSSKRLNVVYGDEGGVDKDGLIELRPGVKDISLGDAHYAQVRILVDGTHYMKGMAVYSDDLPPGIDIQFNTNKKSGTPIMGPKKNTVLKPISDDPENPFNSLIKEKGGQSYYIGDDGKEHLSVINKRADQGDWADWEDTLPSQFLSKQPKPLIKQQLGIALKDKEEQYNDILSITNPVIREDRLLAFADSCDKAAETLKAAPFKNQRWGVIIPVPTMGDKEIFAPQYADGTTLALIRYPHGGTFEIPIVTVNNKNKQAQNYIGMDSIDAVGINAKVASRLSGADFDGDTVMMIPYTSKSRIASRDQLAGLKDFDPHWEYQARFNDKNEQISKHLDKSQTQKEMGIISNLITDMTIKGATEEQLARAVRHSMVVIDADKHNLDYMQSYYDNRIEELKQEYQPNPDNKKGYGGAGTLISRAKSKVNIPLRQGAPRIDEEGNLVYKTASDDKRFYHKRKVVNKKDEHGRLIRDENGNPIPETYIDEYGKEKVKYKESPKLDERTTQVTRMSIAKDANELSSGYYVEDLYAAYANSLKDLARSARKESLNVGTHVYKKEAAESYASVLEPLLASLNVAKQNAPYERAARNAAEREVQYWLDKDDSLYKEDESAEKKLRDRTLKKYRKIYGSKRTTVNITPEQWEAIQSGAVRKSTLKEILRYADEGVVNKYALPHKTQKALSSQKINRIKSLSASNYSLAQIAQIMGISESTVYKYLKEKEND